MYSKIFLLFLISFGVSESLFSEPDLGNPLIPWNLRELCGFRNRPYRIKIPHNIKCFRHPFKDTVVFQPLVETYPNENKPFTRTKFGVHALQGEAPWSVQFGTIIKGEYDFAFTGVLITDRHILTTGHTLRIPQNPDLYVFIGGYKPFSGFRTNKFKYNKHPNATKGQHFDIGIVFLDEPLNLEYLESHHLSKHFQMNPICLPLPEKSVPEEKAYQNATFFSWGVMVNSTTRTWLQRADVEVSYESSINQLATRPFTIPQGCTGDSGAGLVQYLDEKRTRAVLIGILQSLFTSGGTGPLCNRVVQTKFVKLTNVIDWIQERLEKGLSIN